MKRFVFVLCVVSSSVIGFSKAEPPAEKEEAPAPPDGRLDQQGDPLPEGAIARLGTVRWRHGADIVSLSFSPDGKTLASASHDDTVRLWELASGKEIRRFLGQEHTWMSSVAISPDGKTLASASHHNVIRLFETATGKPIRILKGHTHIVWCLAFSPNGDTLASGGGDNTVSLWEVRSGKELRAFQRTNPVNSVAFTPDGRGILTADGKEGVWLWDIASGKDVRHFRVDDRPFHAPQYANRVAVSLDGKLVAAGGNLQNPYVCVWELGSGKQVHHFRDRLGEVMGLAFSPDGKHLASGHRHGSRKSGSPIVLWDLQAGKEVKRLGEPTLVASSLTFSPNGRFLAAGIKEAIRVWDLVEDKEIGQHPGHNASIVSVAVAPDGKTVSTCSYDGTVRLWDARTGAERRLVARFDEYPRASAFTADSKRLVVVSSETSVWDVETGKELSRFFSSHPSWFGALSADGELLAMKETAGVKLWQTATGKELGRIGDMHMHVRDVVLSANGKHLAMHVDSLGDLFQIWETASGKKLQERQPSSKSKHREDAYLSGFTADGRKLLVREDGHLWLLDIHSGEIGRRIPCLDAESSAVSSSGKGIAAGEVSGSIRLFDAATGDVSAEWQGRNYPRPRTTLDPASRTTLMRQHPSEERARLKGHQGFVTCLAFSHDSKTLFSGSSDTTVLVWDLSGIPLSDPESVPVNYLWWIIAAGLLLLALAALWKLLSLFGQRFRSA